ncbi:glycine/D-amino acid oxidase-like deaminating enzyme [Arthrobacter sp. B3I9]|nr:glycine/D-amino acid oxidase-like deaminating enzyme [Arthrobacter sp. B3I9]
MRTNTDTVVIGGGAMGSAAAWALSRRGRDVTLLEQFGPGHRNGASHGATRNFNLAYANPHYVAMLAESASLWSELETDGGEQLLARTGVVNHGTDPRLGDVQNALLAVGLRAEFLPASEAAERWRGIRFNQRVLHMPDGGQLNPDIALPVMQRASPSQTERTYTTGRRSWNWQSATTASASRWRRTAAPIPWPRGRP